MHTLEFFFFGAAETNQSSVPRCSVAYRHPQANIWFGARDRLVAVVGLPGSSTHGVLTWDGRGLDAHTRTHTFIQFFSLHNLPVFF